MQKRKKSASYGGGPERRVLVCFSTPSDTWDHETLRSLCGSAGCNMMLPPFPIHSLRTQQEGLPEPQDELVVPSLATHSRPLVARLRLGCRQVSDPNWAKRHTGSKSRPWVQPQTQ